MNNGNKKNSSSPAPPVGGGSINGLTSANYKSLSSMSSTNQPIYRGLSVASPSLIPSSSDLPRSLMATQQAKQAPSPNANTAILVGQNVEEAALKASKAKATTSSVQTVVSDDAQKNNSEDNFVARDFPIQGFPLSQTYVVVGDKSKLNLAMKSISKTLKGQDKPNKGTIKAQRENGTEIKISAYRDSTTEKLYIEFNRLDGCAFVFQRAFLEAKLAAAPHLENVNPTEIQAEIALVDRRLSFWYGQESSTLLLSLLPAKSEVA